MPSYFMSFLMGRTLSTHSGSVQQANPASNNAWNERMQALEENEMEVEVSGGQVVQVRTPTLFIPVIARIGDQLRRIALDHQIKTWFSFLGKTLDHFTSIVARFTNQNQDSRFTVRSVAAGFSMWENPHGISNCVLRNISISRHTVPFPSIFINSSNNVNKMNLNNQPTNLTYKILLFWPLKRIWENGG